MSSNSKYGKYICKVTMPSSRWQDGGIFHSSEYTDCQDYLKNLYISKNKEFLKRNFFKNSTDKIDEQYLKDNIFTVFVFGEDSFLTDRVSSRKHATEGEVKKIGENTAMLFNGLNATARTDDKTLAHEALHGLGLYHTHQDGDPIIPTPRILCTFEKKATDNYMSYTEVEESGMIQGEEKKTLWRWQWKIVNPNIPGIEKDPK